MPVDLDIPYSAPRVLEHMSETHARFQIEPSHDPTLHFDLVLPRTWSHASEFGPVVDGMLQERGLAIFTASLDHGSPVIAVTVTRVPFEVPIDAWVRMMFEREGWHIVSGKWFPGPNGLFYELTGVLRREDREFVRRTSARADGARIVCVNSMCAREHWNSIKEDFWTAHVTFAPLTPPASSQMEPWLRTRTSGLAFETVHPQSWDSEPAASSSDETSGIHIRLTAVGQDTLYAYILVRAQRRPSIATESLATWLDDALAMLGHSGLVQTDGIRRLTEEEDPRSIGVEGWRGGYVGEGRVGEAELLWRIGFIERNQVLLTMASYSPKSSDDLLIALRAQRAFEIARGGLELRP